MQHQSGGAGLGEASEGVAIGARAQAEVATPESPDQAVGDLPIALATQQGEFMQAEARPLRQGIAQAQAQRQPRRCLADLQQALHQRIVLGGQSGDRIQHLAGRRPHAQRVPLGELEGRQQVVEQPLVQSCTFE